MRNMLEEVTAMRSKRFHVILKRTLELVRNRRYAKARTWIDEELVPETDEPFTQARLESLKTYIEALKNGNAEGMHADY
jgi:hypothetical protein